MRKNDSGERQCFAMDDPIARFQKSQEELEAVVAQFSDEDLTAPGQVGEWSLREVPVNDGYVGALCVRGHGWRLMS